MATRLYVGNLSYSTTGEHLRSLFEEAGTVTNCELVMDKYTNESRGFAFVEMASQEDADKAIEQCNGKDVDGRTLVVNEARPRTERSSQDFKSGFAERGRGKQRSGKGSRRGLRNAKRGRSGSW